VVASGCLVLLQVYPLATINEAAYDYGQKAAAVDAAFSFLSEAMSCIHVTEGFSEILDQEQLENVYCRGLHVSAAVTEYLEKAIIYLTDKRIRTSFSSLSNRQ
jgi:hypothetical protein